MQNACGVRELKTRIRTSTLKQFQLKFLLQEKVKKLNFALVVMKMKLGQAANIVILKKD